MNNTALNKQAVGCTTANDPNEQARINTVYKCPNGVNQVAQISDFTVYNATGAQILQVLTLVDTDILTVFGTPRGTIRVNKISNAINFTSFLAGQLQTLIGRILELAKDPATGDLQNTTVHDTNKVLVFTVGSVSHNAGSKEIQVTARQGNTLRDIAQEIRAQAYFLANTSRCNYIDYSC